MNAPSHQADLDLVRRALARDETALGELGKRLLVVVKLVTAANRRQQSPLPRGEIVDLAQDVTVVIWQKLETFEGRSTLETWAWRFAVLELKNRIRAVANRRYRAGVSLASMELDPAAPEPEPMPHDPDEIEKALAALPSEMSETIRAKHREGLTFAEIGERLKVPENTAKTRYYRGIAQIRAALIKDQGDAGDVAGTRGGEL